MADDFGFQPAAPSNDLGFQPAPKIPDTSAVQNMAQKNVAAPAEAEREPKVLTPAQKLDTAAGMPVSAALKGNAPPLTPEWRGHLVDSYKNGTSTNAGDFMQTMLHSIVPIAARGMKSFNEVGDAIEQTSERYVGTMAYPFLSPENQKKLEATGIVPPPGGSPPDASSPEWVKALHRFAEGAGGTLGTAISAPYMAISAPLAPIINPAIKTAAEASPSGYGSVTPDILNLAMTFGGVKGLHYAATRGAQFPPGAGPWDNHPGADIVKEIINKDDPNAVSSSQIDEHIAQGFSKSAPAAQDFHDVALALNSPADGLTRLYHGGDESSFPINEPRWFSSDIRYAQGYADKSLNGKIAYVDIPTNHPLIEPEWADQSIEKGFHRNVELPLDISTQAKLLENSADALHTIYAETGLRPDQVFEDAQRDPSIKEDIGAGKFPAAYEHLKDTRPPIPDEVKSAMEDMDKLSKEQPPVDLSKEGASKSNNPFVKIFNPAGMSESARDMATALRQGRGPENQDIAVIQEAMKKYAKTFAKMSDEDRLEFINYVETRSEGGKLPNSELREVADKIKEVYAQVAGKIQERFPDVGLRRDYFTHQYEDQAAAEKFFSDWIAKQGSERSLKARAFPTLKEAMEAGLKPKTTNPIETVMNYATNMGNLFAAHRSIELAREMGIADYFRKGQQPTGWEPLNGNLGERDGKILYAPEDAARVYGNDISEGATGPAGDILQSINRVNNFGNMLVLSASMYHFTVTTLSSMAQDIGRALTTGTILERGKNLVQAVTPLANTLKGDKYIQASLYPEAMNELSPELQSAINKAWENNAVNLRNQDYWKAGPAKDYFDIFKNGGVAEEIGKARDTLQEHKITGPVRILANEVGRVMNTISHPLMDTYIPRIKFAATIDNIHAWLKSHPDATPGQIDRAVQDIGNNADNAFGEMMRDNLFWHKITQQTLQTAFLSYSWITGALRMAGKGVPDIGKAILGKQELTADAKYLLGMAATYTVANGVMTYLKTGQPPDEAMDLVAYKTGGLTKEGKPERAFIPSHFPQYWHYLHDGIGEFGNEASPTLKLVYHLLKNRDWRDLPITNENNSWFDAQKWGDYGKYILGEETPIGIKSLLQGKKKGSSITDLEKFMGIRATPRQFTDPEGYAEMMRRVNDAEYKKKERSDRKIQSQYENPDEAE